MRRSAIMGLLAALTAGAAHAAPVKLVCSGSATQTQVGLAGTTTYQYSTTSNMTFDLLVDLETGSVLYNGRPAKGLHMSDTQISFRIGLIPIYGITVERSTGRFHGAGSGVCQKVANTENVF